MSKVKILMVGPTESGKTVLCNFLADATEVSGGDYRPTKGVRILEFDAPCASAQGRSFLDIELWDCSGDKKFEACWPAIAQDTMGIIFVYNQDQENHDRELDSWYQYFVEKQNMKPTSCMVFAHHRPQSSNAFRSDLYPVGGNKLIRLSSANFSQIETVRTNIEDEPDAVRDYFLKFLVRIVKAMTHHREQEELNIMNSR